MDALPKDLLTDTAVELRLIRRLEAGDVTEREPASAFLALAPEYRFAIHRASDGQRVGRIHVRITDRPEIVDVLGHMGYAVDEEHRQRGYATRAIRLAQVVAHWLGQKSLWVLIEPNNLPSRRAVERAGFQFMGEVDTAPAARELGLGPRICRYSGSSALS